MTDDVRIFIGSSSRGEDAPIEAPYEYSLRKNASKELTIEFMRQGLNEHYSGWNTSRWSTPFSGFRWGIPERCGFEGRAIYTDCDQLNFKDIVELFNTDMQGKPLMARRGQRFGGHEFCVMLFDCAAMEQYMIPVSRQKNIEDTHHRFIGMFSGNSQLTGDLDRRWNVLDGEEFAVDDIWHLHYTNMSTQPWKPAWFTGTPQEHPRKDIVDVYYAMKEEAERAGYVQENYKGKPDFEYHPFIGR